jgi:hypothetical protein
MMKLPFLASAMVSLAIGSREQSVNDVQRPCHVVAVSTSRMNKLTSSSILAT